MRQSSQIVSGCDNTGEFLQRAFWLLPPASFSRLGCVSQLAESSSSCESGPEIITETWLLTEGA